MGEKRNILTRVLVFLVLAFGLLHSDVIASHDDVTTNGEVVYKSHFPIVQSRDCTRENVGAAYGWGIQQPYHPRLLCIGFFHGWGIARGHSGLLYAPHYWSDCWYSYCTYNQALAEFCAEDDIARGVITYEGKPIIHFLNEPEIANQANDSPEVAIKLYETIKEICGNKIALFGPMVSSPDRVCYRGSLYPELIPEWYFALQTKYPDWCYLREYIRLMELKGYTMDGYSFHHYPSDYIPDLDWDFDSVYNSFIAVTGDYPVTIMEIGSCEPDIVARDIRQARANENVLYIAGWLPNAPDDSSWSCYSYFYPFGSDNITGVGRAFIDN